MDKDGEYFTCLFQAFPGLTMEKLKAGIFDGPQIRQFIRDPEFENSMKKWNWQSRRHLFWYWSTFLALIRSEPAQNLSTTCWLLSETWAATWASRCTTFFTYGPVSWEPVFTEWWAGVEILSGPERDGDQVSGSLGRSHDGWLQLESEERPSCRWAFQEFKETEFHAMKFEQRWSNMQFTCTYLYQFPPFSLQ